MQGGFEVEVGHEFEPGLAELSSHKLGGYFQDGDSVCLLLVGDKGDLFEAAVVGTAA